MPSPSSPRGGSENPAAPAAEGQQVDTSAGIRPDLTAHHLDDLRKSGLTDQTIIAAAVRSASAEEVRRITGVRDAGPGVVFGYWGRELPSGRRFERVKLDTPLERNESAAKYLMETAH